MSFAVNFFPKVAVLKVLRTDQLPRVANLPLLSPCLAVCLSLPVCLPPPPPLSLPVSFPPSRCRCLSPALALSIYIFPPPQKVAVLEVLQRPRGRQVPTAAAQLCVANTHLYSNPELPDVKLWQCNALLQELEGFVHSRQLPLLVRACVPLSQFVLCSAGAFLCKWPVVPFKWFAGCLAWRRNVIRLLLYRRALLPHMVLKQRLFGRGRHVVLGVWFGAADGFLGMIARQKLT